MTSSREVLDSPLWELLDRPIIEGDCVAMMAALPDCSIDAVVTDPPYGIGFMGHEWDQPGDHGPVRSNGQPAPHRGSATYPGKHVAGGLREGTPTGQRRDRNPAPSGFTKPKTAKEKKLGARAESRERGAAMDAGRYDLSRTANQRYQVWCEAWAREALRVLKPGGHLLASCGTRTYHRLAAGVEDAGFEIRDSILWLYGSGFPKSLDVHKRLCDEGRRLSRGWVGAPYGSERSEQLVGALIEAIADLELPVEEAEWEGWGTALKPSHEPLVVARKPLIGTVAANALEHGVGAVNVDACRIGFASEADEAEAKEKNQHGDLESGPRNNRIYDEDLSDRANYDASGRWPANVVLTHSANCTLVGTTEVDSDGHFPAERGASGYGSNGHHPDSTGGGLKGQEDLDERHMASETVEVWDCAPGCPVAELDAQSGELTSGRLDRSRITAPNLTYGARPKSMEGIYEADSGGASRFFYCAKTSRAERNAGLEGFEPEALNWSSGDQSPGTFQSDGTDKTAVNPHPTVKPIKLMRWLCRLVTPPGGVILDPFLGSGSTGCAAVLEGFEIIGIEREAKYTPIAAARIRWWAEHQGREAEAVLAETAKSEKLTRAHVDAGQLGLEV